MKQWKWNVRMIKLLCRSMSTQKPTTTAAAATTTSSSIATPITNTTTVMVQQQQQQQQQQTKVRPPYGTMLIVIGCTSFAIAYSHYQQVRDKRIMHAGVLRDKERLLLMNYQNKQQQQEQEQ